MIDWTTAACIASGPSLTREDCDQVRAAGIPTIVTNCTWQMCPWANVLYGMDRAFWVQYGDRAAAEFPGRKISAQRSAPHAEHVAFRHGRNSGAGAIALAAKWGARRIILLGYDCQRTGGRRHWHGDHPAGLGNTKKLPSWPAEFKLLSIRMAKEGREIINCTRETALDCFPRMGLEMALRRAVAGMGEATEDQSTGVTRPTGTCQESHL